MVTQATLGEHARQKDEHVQRPRGETGCGTITKRQMLRDTEAGRQERETGVRAAGSRSLANLGGGDWALFSGKQRALKGAAQSKRGSPKCPLQKNTWCGGWTHIYVTCALYKVPHTLALVQQHPARNRGADPS